MIGAQALLCKVVQAELIFVMTDGRKHFPYQPIFSEILVTRCMMYLCTFVANYAFFGIILLPQKLWFMNFF